MKQTCCILAHGLPAMPETTTPLPAEIQYLPPGVSTIVPMWLGGEVNAAEKTVTLNVTPQTAEQLQSLLTNALEEWRRGVSPRPWLDENHLGEKCAAYPLEFYWGGEDPKAGGVRLRVEWTGYGSELIRSRAYSFFSPSLLIQPSGREGEIMDVAGLLNNAGGLVNEPAFRRIQQISARAQAQAIVNKNQTIKGDTMDELKNQITALAAELGRMAARLNALEQTSVQQASAAALQAATARIDTLQETWERQHKDAAQKAAKAIVANAVQSGKLVPQDRDAIKAWEEILAADPARAELLARMPGNAVLQNITPRAANTAPENSSQMAAAVRNRADAIHRESKSPYSVAWKQAQAEIQ